MKIQNVKNYLDETWFLCLELLICAIVGIDIALRIYMIGLKRFTKNTFNVIDILLSLFSCIEIIIVGFDIFFQSWSSILAFIALLIRNLIMIIRIIIIMRRGMQSRADKTVIKIPTIIINREKESLSMEEILETNLENIKVAYRARLDTLGEEDEILESSQATNGSIWKGRMSQSQRINSEQK